MVKGCESEVMRTDVPGFISGGLSKPPESSGGLPLRWRIWLVYRDFRVDPTRLELVTSAMRRRRSPS